MEIEALIKDLNKEIKSCTKCSLAETRTNALCGEGNLHTRIMLVAQAPGEKEDIQGRMFIGPSGKMLDELLHETGVKRKELYMTNLIKCRLPRNRRPKQTEIEACSPFLEKEISLLSPEIMVPLGYYATRHLLSIYDIPVPGAKEEFSGLYGRLLMGGNQKLYPLPHPASLLYNRSFKLQTTEKYRKLKVFSHECKWFPLCPIRNFVDQGKLSVEWIELYCKGDWGNCVRYNLEENGEYHSDRMLPDGTFIKEGSI